MIVINTNDLSTDDELRRAGQLERLGDEAASLGQPAAGHYLESQRLLLPPGVVWTDREAYAFRKDAFDRIQEKLYSMDGTGRPRNRAVPLPEPANREACAPAATSAEAAPTALPGADLSVWQFYPGLELRVVRSFRDYDGQQVQAGEVLRLLASSYFFYDGGHTLEFAGKTIRLADVVEEHQAIIANAGNAWFQPLGGDS